MDDASHRITICALALAASFAIPGCEMKTFGALAETGAATGAGGGAASPASPVLDAETITLASSTRPQLRPALAAANAGTRLVAVWQDGPASIAGKSIGSSAAGQPTTVSTAGGSVSNVAVAAAGATSELLFAWQEGARIVTRLASVESGTLEVRGQPIDLGVAGASFPALAASPSPAHYLIIYYMPEESGAFRQLWGQRFAPGATPGIPFVIDRFQVDSAAAPSIQLVPGGADFAVCWVRGGGNDTQVLKARIPANTLDPAGSVSGVVAVSPTTPARRRFASRLAAAQTELLAVWVEAGETGAFDLMSQRLRSDLTLSGPAQALAQNRQELESPAAAAGADRFLVAWQEGAAVRARVLPGETVLAVSPESESASAPAVAYDAAGREWTVAWQSGNTIRARRVRLP